MSVFIYQPRSGSRVFASQIAATIGVVRWSNGCRHVLGGLHLEWSSAVPRQHWRTPGRALATSVVQAVGGIAWDEQGLLHLIVPRRSTFRAWELMNALGAQHGSLAGNDNAVRLVAEGAARLSGPDLLLERSWIEEEPSMRMQAELLDGRWRVRVVDQVGGASAPAAWGPPETESGELEVVTASTTAEDVEIIR
jgi:hypothetical protein